jgi:hypothetical protein
MQRINQATQAWLSEVLALRAGKVSVSISPLMDLFCAYLPAAVRINVDLRPASVDRVAPLTRYRAPDVCTRKLRAYALKTALARARANNTMGRESSLWRHCSSPLRNQVTVSCQHTHFNLI